MDITKAHFIGIAGKGMSAVALLLREAGVEITGSDEGFYPPVSVYLTEANIPFHNGYKKENIPSDADVIVIGKNAKLVPESNEEVAAAFASGKKVLSFPDVLHELTLHTDNIVVAGSYGKSTSTALLAWCLLHAGKDPSYFIGEITKGLEAHAHKGTGEVFVLEGDEYPSANWDENSKFLHYNPHTVLLTSATHDHVNVYPTHESYLAPFKKLISILPQSGLLVVNANETHALALSAAYAGKVVTYGNVEPAEWYPHNIVYGMPSTFDLMHQGTKIISLTTPLLGAHNIENIVGISAVLLEKGLLTSEELAKGIMSFEGVRRRMEYLSPRSSVAVYEGFGSSYEKAKAAVAAMKLHFPNRRLTVVFEPHTFTWRNKASLHQYDDVFLGADHVFIFSPPHDGKETQLGAEEIANRVSAHGTPAVAVDTPEAMLNIFEKELKANDAVLLSSSGAMGGLIESIPALAEQKFPK
ncbi:MAG: Mur ligase family protein [Minisyncoccia bacterium]|jgi:UDP-N-acetylmuramate: L-alanyl-gamma-D-glutamyl-meso-diaminopimelate ligase